MSGEPSGGLLVMPNSFTMSHRETIVATAARYRVPAIYAFRAFPASGGLMSYGMDMVSVYRDAAAYVDRILRGEKPGDLPVQAPTRFELVINVKAARALGVDVPPMLLARADEVIRALAKPQLDRRSGSQHSPGARLDRSSATDGRHWRRQLANDWRQRHRCRPVACCKTMARSRHGSGRAATESDLRSMRHGGRRLRRRGR